MNDQPLWRPSPRRVEDAAITRFSQFVRDRYPIAATDYAALWQWSVDAPDDFWTAVLSFCDVSFTGNPQPALIDGHRLPGARWFPEVRLNYAENLLRRRDDAPALVFWNERGRQSTTTFGELYEQTARLAARLQEWGIRPGDRVAVLLPNMPQAIVILLAAASLGAVFSSCSPDFGVPGIVDRFGQIAPRVLFVAEGYLYAGKTFATLEKAAAVVEQIPSIERVVLVPYLDGAAKPASDDRWTTWDAAQNSPFSPASGEKAPKADEGAVTDIHEEPRSIHQVARASDPPFSLALSPEAGAWGPDQDQEIQFAPLPFDHPLYVLYSSGTTGVPKCIVHGHGGTLLQHLKEHRLHTDLKPGDRLFYFTTTGWMMWNWLVSGLASACTLILFDGSPMHPTENILWEMADAERINVFGTSAKYLSALEKAGAKPQALHRLDSLTTILSTGSPLVPESFDYVYRDIKADVCLSSISGGTDIVSCFVLGNPTLPVSRGEIQCRGLGMKVEVFDEAGQPVVGQMGELVCTRPFPSMPVGFWNDPDGAKYRAAYFEKYPGVWRHGDFAELTPRGTVIIAGRSDAVLNPGGVRIGTAEIYRQVEQVPEVLEAIAVGQQWRGDVRIVLFVRLRDGSALTDDLRKRIAQQVRAGATPRHVPAVILVVTEIPRTRSGKIVELAVTEVIHGRPVQNVAALANPEALEQFRNRPELQEI